MNERTHTVVKGGYMLLTGLMIGSGTGFLLAPKSGARTRRRLRALAEDLGERVGDIAADARWVFWQGLRTGLLEFQGWRRLNCGDVLNGAVLRHRAYQGASPSRSSRGRSRDTLKEWQEAVPGANAA